MRHYGVRPSSASGPTPWKSCQSCPRVAIPRRAAGPVPGANPLGRGKRDDEILENPHVDVVEFPDGVELTRKVECHDMSRCGKSQRTGRFKCHATGLRDSGLRMPAAMFKTGRGAYLGCALGPRLDSCAPSVWHPAAAHGRNMSSHPRLSVVESSRRGRTVTSRRRVPPPTRAPSIT